MINIVTSESRRRALRATVDGIGPETAEILQSLGIDPRTWAAEIRARRLSRAAIGATRASRTAPALVGIPRPEGAKALSLDRGDLSHRQMLNEVAMESMEDSFIQEIVAPVQLVDDSSGRLRLASRTANRAEVDDEMADRARANRVPSGLSTIDYDCKPYGLESDVNEQLAGEFPLLENVAAETRRLGGLVYLQQELRVVRDTLFASGSYHASNAQNLGSGFQWNGGTDANPIRNMNAALASMTAPPTHYVASLEVFQAIQENDDLRAIVASHPDNRGLLSVDEFGMYFGIPDAVVNRGDYAPASTPSTLTRILSTTDLAIVHVNPARNMRSFMRQIRMRRGANGIVTRTWFSPEAGGDGFTHINVNHMTHLKIIDNQQGALIQNVRRV